jgi:hypothetical protein
MSLRICACLKRGAANDFRNVVESSNALFGMNGECSHAKPWIVGETHALKALRANRTGERKEVKCPRQEADPGARNRKLDLAPCTETKGGD